MCVYVCVRVCMYVCVCVRVEEGERAGGPEADPTRVAFLRSKLSAVQQGIHLLVRLLHPGE